MSTPSYKFDAEDADVIIRTTREQGSGQFKDFRVHKTILSIASALFCDMFSLPQPSQHAAGDNALPIIPVSESPEIFENFLRLIYPVEPPEITSLQLLGDLFRVADKYMANGVHTRLKQILAPSTSFLRDDPIRVYALACRANLDAVAELAIPHTFKIDPVRDIPPAYLQMMTAETYNRLLTAHATRRTELISAVNAGTGPPYPGECSCGLGFYTRLRKDINLAIWEKPFLDRQRLETCIPSSESKCGRRTGCRVSEKSISEYFTSILDKIGKPE